MFIEKLKNHFYSSRGWKTNRKIVVIESDDWGGIRTQSDKVLENLNNENTQKNFINRVDSLESYTDLEILYECLSKHKDSKGNNPVITANFVMSNPDFDKIKDSNFEKYFYEPFYQSYKTYYDDDRIEGLIKEGINSKFFYPQFHGREHVHVEYWMDDLKQGNPLALKGFENKFFCFNKSSEIKNGYLSSFNTKKVSDIEPVKLRIEEGLKMFHDVFGHDSLSIIPPQNTMHYSLLPFTKESGIKYIQGARKCKQPILKDGDKTTYNRFTGKNSANQIDVVRNVSFEPASFNADWVKKCMEEISIAFTWKKPAVICSHRFNYAGTLDEKNRDNNIKQLDALLSGILQKWPETEFLHTEQLGAIINNSINK